MVHHSYLLFDRLIYVSKDLQKELSSAEIGLHLTHQSNETDNPDCDSLSDLLRSATLRTLRIKLEPYAEDLSIPWRVSATGEMDLLERTNGKKKSR